MCMEIEIKAIDIQKKMQYIRRKKYLKGKHMDKDPIQAVVII